MILVVSIPVWKGMMSLRVRIAITTSSNAVLPARSPRPLMVHSIWRAPPIDGRQRIRCRHAKVVVAVGGKDHLICARNRLDQAFDQIRGFQRRSITPRCQGC